MNGPDPASLLWSRPQLEPVRPFRGFGALFRTQGEALGGIPLTTLEDAAIAAVRTGYRVAEAQVERSNRLAERLRKAGDAAVGESSERKAIDATEQLIFRWFMGVVGWMEAAAAEGDTPLKRLMVAQYRIIGSILGVNDVRNKESAPEDVKINLADILRAAATRSAGATETPADAETAKGAAPSPKAPKRPSPTIRIAFGDTARRRVRVRDYELPNVPELAAKAVFYSADKINSAPIQADLVIGANGYATITFKGLRNKPAGVWVAAICGDENVQVGFIEIEI